MNVRDLHRAFPGGLEPCASYGCIGRGDRSTLLVVAIKYPLELWPSKISIVEGKYIECGLNDASRWLSGNAWANEGVVLRRQTPRKRAEGGVSNNASRN
jgi:hypothetical protein